MSDTDTLGKAILANEAGTVIAALEKAVREGTAWAPDVALACLGDERPGVRNAGAMTLLDLRDERAPEAVRASLVRPGVAPQSGTLVYVLHELGGHMTLGAALSVARDGSFEARAEMVEMMREGLVEAGDPLVIADVLIELATLSELGDEAGNAATEVVDAFERRSVSGGRIAWPT
jgi:hypothetical protein